MLGHALGRLFISFFHKTVGLADLVGNAMAKLYDRIQFVFAHRKDCGRAAESFHRYGCDCDHSIDAADRMFVYVL